MSDFGAVLDVLDDNYSGGYPSGAGGVGWKSGGYSRQSIRKGTGAY